MELNIPQVSGIDALYYFVQSGTKYDSFYEDILEQLELKKQEFESINYNYQPNDIVIQINGIDVKHSGKSRDGFYWFNHDFFRIGFKDSEKAMNIQNIRVQCNSIGIYTLGLKSLIEYINTQVLKDVIADTNYFPVTRIDVNMFIQHNFNYINKDMIVSKKKNHASTIGERSSGYELETYYVGQRPFMLRIYNKMIELKGASDIKREMMLNHFGVNGLDIKGDIFNVEFEMHREFLSKYGIDTIEDALERAETLFKMGCELVRLIDTDSVSEKQINSSNRNKAYTLPVWKYIHDSYDNKDFMQITTPMEKVEKITYRYSLEDARRPLKRIMNRLMLHNNKPTLFFFYELMEQTQEEFNNRHNYRELQERSFENKDSTYPAPKKYIDEDFTGYSNEGLQKFEKSLSKEMQGIQIDDPQYDELLHTYNSLHDELVNRGLVEFPF